MTHMDSDTSIVMFNEDGEKCAFFGDYKIRGEFSEPPKQRNEASRWSVPESDLKTIPDTESDLPESATKIPSPD
jgi:hypothetical protein